VISGQIGASHGTSQHQPYDRWFRYPAGFSASTLSRSLDAAEVVAGSHVIDPFAGAATVGTAVRLRDGSFTGIETHPLIAQLGQLKLASSHPDPVALRLAGQRMVSGHLPASTADEHEMVRRCFPEPILARLVGLREGVGSMRPEFRGYATWALLGALRDVASSKVGWPYQRPGSERRPLSKDPDVRFLTRLNRIADDLSDHPLAGFGCIVRGDARQAEPWLLAAEHGEADAAITSPPYLNNFDYADATRLELYFLGAVRSWRQMCDEVRSGMVIASTQQTRKPLAAEDLGVLQQAMPSTWANVEPLVDALEVERRRRPRGKEYDRVLPSYTLGIARVFARMHRLLRADALVVVVIGDSAPYGVPIDTPALIATAASEIGYEVVSQDVLRSRGARWRTNGTRHQVALNERLLLLRRTADSAAVSDVLL